MQNESALEPLAWLHPTDPMRAISQAMKQSALKDGGASAKSVMPYSVPAYASPMTSNKPVAWLHPNDNMRAITQAQLDGAISDGGAILKAMAVCNIPVYI